MWFLCRRGSQRKVLNSHALLSERILGHDGTINERDDWLIDVTVFFFNDTNLPCTLHMAALLVEPTKNVILFRWAPPYWWWWSSIWCRIPHISGVEREAPSCNIFCRVSEAPSWWPSWFKGIRFIIWTSRLRGWCFFPFFVGWRLTRQACAHTWWDHASVWHILTKRLAMLWYFDPHRIFPNYRNCWSETTAALR